MRKPFLVLAAALALATPLAAGPPLPQPAGEHNVGGAQLAQAPRFDEREFGRERRRSDEDDLGRERRRPDEEDFGRERRRRGDDDLERDGPRSGEREFRRGGRRSCPLPAGLAVCVVRVPGFPPGVCRAAAERAGSPCACRSPNGDLLDGRTAVSLCEE